MEDLRRTGSLRAKKGSHSILARARSEGLTSYEDIPLELPQRSFTPLPNLPPMRPRKYKKSMLFKLFYEEICEF